MNRFLTAFPSKETERISFEAITKCFLGMLSGSLIMQRLCLQASFPETAIVLGPRAGRCVLMHNNCSITNNGNINDNRTI